MKLRRKTREARFRDAILNDAISLLRDQDFGDPSHWVVVGVDSTMDLGSFDAVASQTVQVTLRRQY